MPEHLNLAGVPALTLHNPWAHLIAHHGKNVENRDWAPGPIIHLMIHAGRGWDWAADATYRHLYQADPPIISAIVAVVRVDRICSATANATAATCDCGAWARRGAYHWRLRQVLTLPEPVCGVAGRQGLWYPAAHVRAAVEHQAGRLAESGPR